MSFYFDANQSSKLRRYRINQAKNSVAKDSNFDSGQGKAKYKYNGPGFKLISYSSLSAE
jgi:hypothetical protein